VKKYESNSSLVIIDSVRAYQMVTFYGVLRLIQLLAERAQKDARAGVFSLADRVPSSCLIGKKSWLVMNYLYQRQQI
jgi:hypothetical protein